MLDPTTVDILKNHLNKEIKRSKDHISYSVESIEQLMYSRGKINALEALLQDIKNLQKENNDGTID